MTDKLNTNNINLSEITLSSIFRIIRREKFLILSLTSIFSISSIIYSLSLPNIFMSSSLLIVNESGGGSSRLSGLIGEYGGLASLAGVDLPSGSSSDKASLAIEMVLSRDLVRDLIKKDNILPILMATKSYDSVNKKVIFDNSIYDSKKNTWVRKPTKNYQTIPSYLEAHREYLKIVDISKDKKTNYITIRVRHQSPQFSEYLLSSIISEVNQKVRLKDLEIASNSIEYLQSLVKEVSFQRIKTSINNLVESNIESQMLASIDEEYLFRPIDPPYTPEIRFAPSRSMIVILITILGGFLSMIFVLIRNFA